MSDSSQPRSQSTPLKGYATPEGTLRYASRSAQDTTIAEGHFHSPFDGLIFSSLGMGTYLGEPDAETDQQVTDAVVQTVASNAVNVIDTAINYRLQKAERSVGKALEQLLAKGYQRDELFISSKNGYLSPDADASGDFRSQIMATLIEPGIITPQDIAGGSHCMTPAYLKHQLDTSLQNLGLETLDLMYLHNAAESQLPAVGRDEFMRRLEAAFAFYETARSDNKIRYYGLATWNCFRCHPAEVHQYLNLETVVALARKVGGESHGFRFIQLPYNLAMPEAGSDDTQTVGGEAMPLLEAAVNLKIGVFTSVPLMQGQLLTHALPQFEGLSNPAQHCLQFVRSTPGILAPLAGHKQAQHVKDNLAVARVSPASPEQLKRSLAVL